MATNNMRFVAKNGLDNNSNSIANLGAAGASLTLSGANALTITTTGPTSVTFPTSGTLATTTSSISGNAVSASVLQVPRAINGVNFDGSAAITVTANAATVTGTTLASGVTASSLTSVGTLASLTVTGTITAGAFTGPVTGAVTGNASTATKLATARNINGILFDGTADITLATSVAAAGTLTGTTLAAGVTASSLTSVGTIATGVWNATDVALAAGGTNASLVAVTGGVVYSNATAMAITAAGTTKQVLTSNGAAAPSWSTLDMTYLPDAAFKKSCVCATTASIGASFAADVLTGPIGVLVLDGITVVLNDRILVKDQTAVLQNGIYAVTTLGTAAIAWVLTRVAGGDTSSELAGAVANVDSGTQGGNLYKTNFKTTDVINTTSVNWYKVIDSSIASAVVGSTPGTAAVGTSISYARADHVHPIQTTVTGNAVTATTATNVAGGVIGSVHYQSAAGTTAMLAVGATGTVLTVAGGVPTWAAAAGGGGVTIADDTATATTYYPTFSTIVSGTLSTAKISTTKLTYLPSTGTLSATIFTSLSDASKKTNIQPIVDASKITNQMAGVTFDWKDGSGSSYGFIAQELEKIIPYAVITDPQGIKSVNYSAVVPFLLESLKEQDSRIIKLEELVNTLISKVQ